MKDITIRITITIFLLCTAISCDAKVYNSIDDVISEQFPETKKQVKDETQGESVKKVKKTKKVANLKLVKDKKGNIKVPWNLLKEYDLESKDIGANLKKVVDQKIVITGFMIPLDYSSKKIKEFLLVPYMPNCAHVPPPPANMIISVTMGGGKSIKSGYWPFEVEGKLTITKKMKQDADAYIADGAYRLLASSVKELKQ